MRDEDEEIEGQEYLTVQQVAERMQYTERAIRKMLSEGRLRGVKVGRKWLIPREVMDQVSGETGLELVDGAQEGQTGPEVRDGPTGAMTENNAPDPHQTPGKDSVSGIGVTVDTDYQHQRLESNLRCTWLDPVRIEFSLSYRGADTATSLQLHTWFYQGRTFLDTQLTDTDLWREEGVTPLPEEWQPFSALGDFERCVLRLSSANGFALIPGNYPTTLPPLRIIFSRFIGMIPMPWVLEVPGHALVAGTLLLWRTRDGIFHSEQAEPGADLQELADRVNRIIRSR